MFTMVTKELKAAEDIVSSADIHVPRVGPLVDPKLIPYLGEGRTITSTADVGEAISGWISHQAFVVENAERLHLGELRTLSKLRDERDKVKKLLYQKVLKVRTTIEGTFGTGKSSQFVGLDAGLSNVEPMVLKRYARPAYLILSNPDFEPPETGLPGAAVDPREAAADLLPTLERFEQILKEMDNQSRVVEDALKVKTQELEELHTVTTGGSKVLEGLYKLAGEEFHSERLRRSTRTRGRSTEPEAEASSPKETGDEATGPAADRSDGRPQSNA